ncbi:SIMPL domain-containing protein [Aeromicrobium endophyticum]|uniref:SIMPL domain-containing protein n=2 Tax=Aeromicrobium endophyticum TaxID=2292704 RepID=A0A371PCC7_9ACTN|nr:SIMPL domain-containing protein [Aeromicrobium endophyticum]
MGQDVRMTLDITVRGSAEQHHPAERATVALAAAIEGPDRAVAFSSAVAIQDPLSAHLKELVDLHAVTTWSSDQVRVFSHRPWDGEGRRGEAVHVARVQLRAEFTDFERLSSFVDHWSSVDGVEIGGVEWDVSAKSRRVHEAEVRKAAVDDAVAKAQTYANAVRRGKVVATQIADPGMLVGPGDPSAVPMLKAAFADGHGPELDLTPQEIVIRVEVDARFQAD